MDKLLLKDLEEAANRRILTTYNRIQMECEELIALKVITREQADRRVRNAKGIVDYLIRDKVVKEGGD